MKNLKQNIIELLDNKFAILNKIKSFFLNTLFFISILSYSINYFKERI